MNEKKSTSKKDKIIAWQAPEFQYIHKNVDWYWVVGSIGLLLTIGTYMTGNWSLALLIFISTIVLTYISGHKPRMFTMSLSKKTIEIENNIYYLKNFAAYNIDEDRDKLLLKSHKEYKPLTIAPLPHDAPKDKIIQLLEDEVGLELNTALSEPVIDIIMHRLGF